MRPNLDISLEYSHIRNGKVLYTRKKQSESLLKNFMHLVMVAALAAKTTDVSGMTIKDFSGTVITPGTNGGDFQNVGNVRPWLVVGIDSTAVSTNDFKLASVPVLSSVGNDVDTVSETTSGSTVTRIYTDIITNNTSNNITLLEAGLGVTVSLLGTNRDVLIIRDIITDLQPMLPQDQVIMTYSLTIVA